MERDHRLRKEREFRAVYQGGRSWATPLLVLRGLPNTIRMTRIGFVVGRRVGKAVVRNRLKRRLREIVGRTPIREGWDIVFISRPAAADASFQQLHDAVGVLLQRSHLQQTPEKLEEGKT